VPESNSPNNNNATASFDESPRNAPFHGERKQTPKFLGLPIEKDADLVTDQRILGEVLKEPMFEVTSVFLVLLSSLLVALSTVNSIDLQTFASIIRLENIIAYAFALEFFARWFSHFTWKGIPQYLLQPLVLIDLVVVILPLIPLLIPDVSSNAYEFLPNWLFSSTGLVNLRLLRVLRLQRVLTDRETFADFQIALGIPGTEVKPYKLELARVVISIFTLLSISTGLIYSTEHAVNSAMPTYFDALYFSLTTLTSVGFGDITPVTAEGKLVVSGSILAGVAVIPVQAAALVEALLAREQYKSGDSLMSDIRSKASSQRNNPSNMILQTSACPNCDAGFHWANAEYCWSCGSKLEGFNNDDR
jgi:voltage-gated potassium channel